MRKSLFGVMLMACALNAQAQLGMAPPSGVLSIEAQTSVEIPHDTVHLTLAAEQEGSDPSLISNALSKKAQQVLDQAQKTPGVIAKTGGFTIYPSNDGKGRIAAWRGRVEVLVESADFSKASRLAGELSSLMQLAGVNFSLSYEAQRSAEDTLAEQAIGAFRAKAQRAARAFGYSDYTIREVTLGQSGGSPPPRMYMAKSVMSSMADSAPVPLEGGKARVTVTVSGAVQMFK